MRKQESENGIYQHYKKNVTKAEFAFRFELLVNVLSTVSGFSLKAYAKETAYEKG